MNNDAHTQIIVANSIEEEKVIITNIDLEEAYAEACEKYATSGIKGKVDEEVLMLKILTERSSDPRIPEKIAMFLQLG